TTIGGPLTDDDTVEVDIPADPGLTSVKSAELDDANGNGVADEGETITYTIRATNTGNVTLTGVSVNDPLLPDLDEPAELLPGASHDFVGTYDVTPDDVAAGEVVNSATATGTPPSGPPITTPPTTTTIETVRVGITLVKSAEWTDVDDDGDVEEGDQITYRFVVTNTGNVTLDDVEIADAFLADRDVAITASGSSIAPGEQLVFTSEALTVETADIIDGEVVNTATAFGTPVAADPIESDESTARVPLAEPAPS